MKRIVLLILIAIGIVSPKINNIDFPVISFICLVIFNYRTKTPLLKIQVEFILLWILTLLIACVSYLANGEIDLIFLLKPIRQIILILLIHKIVNGYEISTKDFLKF